MVHRLLVCLCVVLFACYAVEGKVVRERAKGHEFVFLTKFCYGYGDGTANYTVTANNGTDTSNMYLLFVDDQTGNWTAIYKQNLNCSQRMAKSSPIIVTSGNAEFVTFEDVRTPHFWYLSILNCGQPIDVEFDITMLQQDPSKWVRQFSADEQGLEGLYLFYFILFLLCGVVHGYTIWTFVQTDSYHTIVKLFTVTIAFEGLSVFCLFVHYAVYSENGIGAPGLKGVGEILDITAQIVFILLLVLIAKGWCISKTTIDDRIVVLVGLGVLIAAYLAMFIWENVGLDPASTLYVYQTAPGIIIVVIRAIAMFWFVYCVRSTYMQENNAGKRKFYLWFGVAFLVWFLSLPFSTMIASGLDNYLWMKQKTVVGLYVTFNTVFLFVLGFLLWPSRAHEYFQITARDLGSMPYDAI